MKILLISALAAGLLTACSTTSPHENHAAPSSPPETVLVTYHVKPGQEDELKQVLARAWEVYRKEHLVFAEPHVIYQEKEDGDKLRIVEIFTWVSHDAPDHAPESVKTVWNQMQSLCEARNKHGALGGGEVELITPQHSTRR